jgi:hypothetical protein
MSTLIDKFGSWLALRRRFFLFNRNTPLQVGATLFCAGSGGGMGWKGYDMAPPIRLRHGDLA